jgi:glycerol kinase
MPAPLLLAIDQGTTSSRAIVFDLAGSIVSSAQQEFRQIFPADAWVEHDPEEIWQTTLQTARQALTEAELTGARVAGIGITNQRETTLLWDRKSGKTIGNAIVWQDRRTAAICQQLQQDGHEETFSSRTGLLIDPYFSATKLAWMLDQDPQLRQRAAQGELAFGTVDSYLLWRLSGGKVHATDVTNASRTMLFNIHSQQWDAELLQLLNIPAPLLPEVKDCATDFGTTAKGIFERPIPLCGVAGDQQAAAIGQACFHPGMLKSTYGTGCFVLMNTGDRAVKSQNRLLTTIAYRLNGKTSYALEGSIFSAGSAVQWLRDALGLIDSAAESEAIAAGISSTAGVYMVPAFTGLAAPHWDPQARGALIGLTRDSGRAEIVRATLESVAYQTADLLQGMEADSGIQLDRLRVDGGMAANNWLMEFLAGILNLQVDRPAVTETTALGAAYLAGLQLGLFKNLAEIERRWQLRHSFTPQINSDQRDSLRRGWSRAIERVLLG